jgi:sulfur transfer complex TusBCD TusB component (DsrH family)
MLHYVLSSLIYNSQKLERTQMSLNRGMDAENVILLHNGVLLIIKQNDFMKCLGKWVDLEGIILSEVT